MPDTFKKDPNAKLDYTVDWSGWLSTGETISASTWTVSTGLTISTTPAPSFTGTTATVWLEGGTVGGGEELAVVGNISQRAYRVTNRITTNAGRIDDRSIFVAVAER